MLIVTQSLFTLLVLLSSIGRPAEPPAPPVTRERPAIIQTLAEPVGSPVRTRGDRLLRPEIEQSCLQRSL